MACERPNSQAACATDNPSLPLRLTHKRIHGVSGFGV